MSGTPNIFYVNTSFANDCIHTRSFATFVPKNNELTLRPNPKL